MAIAVQIMHPEASCHTSNAPPTGAPPRSVIASQIAPVVAATTPNMHNVQGRNVGQNQQPRPLGRGVSPPRRNTLAPSSHGGPSSAPAPTGPPATHRGHSSTVDTAAKAQYNAKPQSEQDLRIMLSRKYGNEENNGPLDAHAPAQDLSWRNTIVTKEMDLNEFLKDWQVADNANQKEFTSQNRKFVKNEWDRWAYSPRTSRTTGSAGGQRR